MKSIQVTNLNSELLEALKQLAKAHHRSFQGELHFILENGVSNARLKDNGALDLITVSTGRQPVFNMKEIYEDDGR